MRRASWMSFGIIITHYGNETDVVLARQRHCYISIRESKLFTGIDFVFVTSIDTDQIARKCPVAVKEAKVLEKAERNGTERCSLDANGQFITRPCARLLALHNAF